MGGTLQRCADGRLVRCAATGIIRGPCAMECRVDRFLEYGRRLIVIGEVVQMHIRRDCLDEAGRYVNPETYQPIARLHADNYITSDRQFVMPTPPMPATLNASEQVD